MHGSKPVALDPTDHLVLLAPDPGGYAALSHLVTRAQFRGVKDAPRYSYADLAEASTTGSLVALTGCREGAVPRAARDGDLEGALEAAVQYMQEVTREMARFHQDYDVVLSPVLSKPGVRTRELSPDLPYEKLLERVVAYVTSTPVALLGPSLVTVSVKTTLVPTSGVESFAVLTNDRSARAFGVGVSAS